MLLNAAMNLTHIDDFILLRWQIFNNIQTKFPIKTFSILEFISNEPLIISCSFTQVFSQKIANFSVYLSV